MVVCGVGGELKMHTIHLFSAHIRLTVYWSPCLIAENKMPGSGGRLLRLDPELSRLTASLSILKSALGSSAMK